jgi:hypothetical protein
VQREETVDLNEVMEAALEHGISQFDDLQTDSDAAAGLLGSVRRHLESHGTRFAAHRAR